MTEDRLGELFTEVKELRREVRMSHEGIREEIHGGPRHIGINTRLTLLERSEQVRAKIILAILVGVLMIAINASVDIYDRFVQGRIP